MPGVQSAGITYDPELVAMTDEESLGLRQRLESLARAGVTQLPKSRLQVRPPFKPADPSSTPAGPQTAQRQTAQPRPEAAAAADGLAVLRDEVAACTRCGELAASRTQTVFGAGRVDARLVFFGEAPGGDEDTSGVPFVGRAGQLLTKIIEACRLSRDDVYIMNVLKCRPPNNRSPGPSEVLNCRPYFERQLELIRPEFICCLGATAARALLSTDEAIGSLRRRWFTYGTAEVICTYHPSYLLRNPAAKREVWDDMKLLMARMGVEL